MLLHQFDHMVQGKLVRRYKRFLADVLFSDAPTTHDPEVVHCPNTGAMTGLLDRALAPALCSISSAKGRKYAHTLEALQPGPCSTWVGVHSALANKLARQALDTKALQQQIGDYSMLQAEVAFGKENKSRVDFVLSRPLKPGDTAASKVYVEVKSATMAEPHTSLQGVNIALFPDTVSERAQKHVRELIQLRQAGHEAVCLFVIQRGDCTHFAPCWQKDPRYAQLLKEASDAGVTLVAMRCEISVHEGRASVLYLGPATIELGYREQEAAVSKPPSKTRVSKKPKLSDSAALA